VKKIGFIGTGNMAQAIIRGMIRTGNTTPKNIFCTDICTDKLLAFATETDVTVCGNNNELVGQSDVVVLAVKPYALPAVLGELREAVSKRQPLMVSVAAAVTLEDMSRVLYYGAPIVRVMPNVNATVGAGMSAVCGGEFAAREQIDYVLDLFTAVGVSTELPERDFPCFSALAGSAPAFAYMFIDSLARGAVRHGLSKDTATKIAAQTVLGSAKMILESNEVPWALVDKVCSPGGMTIEGVAALERGAFVADVMDAMDAAVRRDAEMRGD